MKPRICFFGLTRYSFPLSASTQKKFQALADVANIHVIGFSSGLRPQSFFQHAHFHLLPWHIGAPMRPPLFLVGGFLLLLWLVFLRGVRLIVAQSPYEGLAATLVKVVTGAMGMRVALVVESHSDFERYLSLQRKGQLPLLYRMVVPNIA